MAGDRVSVGIRTQYHKEIAELASLTNHKVAALVDLAVRNFLKDMGPVLRRAAKEVNGK